MNDPADRPGRRDEAAGADARLDDIDDRFFAAYLDTIAGRIGQSRSAAETVQRGAAAIGGFYGAVLGVAFSVNDHALPLRGLIPLVFLGLAIVTSTVHLAWQGGTTGSAVTTVHPERELEPFARRRAYAIDFQRLVADFLHRRLSWLRAAIVSLAIGLVLLPSPFIEVDTGDAGVAEVPEMEAETSLAAVEPPWPEIDTSAVVRPEDEALRLARYQAEVEEVARLRAQQLERPVDRSSTSAPRLHWLPDSGWALLTGVLLAATLAVALFAKEGPR